MQDIRLKIDRMKCGGCTSRVRTVLEHVSGVLRAEVSLENSEARVSAEDAVEPADLVGAVRGAGYEAFPEG